MQPAASMSPHVVTWELTRACALHCRHCRAKAVRQRDRLELSLTEMGPVLDDLASYDGPPVLVFTGGDPLEREDLPEILEAAAVRKLHTAMAPSVTPRLTLDVLKTWRDLKVGSVALSLDGSRPKSHDGFRQSPGTFIRTIEMARAIVSQGMRLQVNTSVGTYTKEELPAIGQLVKALGVSSWEIFVVVPTGRAGLGEALTAPQIEAILRWIAEYSQTVAFRVTVVGAPQYRRVLDGASPTSRRPPLREGRGFAFIDHQGFVYPSGYLPLKAGNVRYLGFQAIYREAPLMADLRDASLLKGPCGRCAWTLLCGGSRARAYAVTQDVFASDPGCLYAVEGVQ